METKEPTRQEVLRDYLKSHKQITHIQFRDLNKNKNEEWLNFTDTMSKLRSHKFSIDYNFGQTVTDTRVKNKNRWWKIYYIKGHLCKKCKLVSMQLVNEEGLCSACEYENDLK